MSAEALGAVASKEKAIHNVQKKKEKKNIYIVCFGSSLVQFLFLTPRARYQLHNAQAHLGIVCGFVS